MGGCFGRDVGELADVKKTAEVDSFLHISNHFVGGAPPRDELNFLSILSEFSGVSDDDAIEIWGGVVGPGKAFAKPSGRIADFKGNVVIGFLPYKGPTEKARMVMAFKQDPWLDCRVWASWGALKQASAGTASLPTGCLPMVWDDSLKTPSGACHRISEWVAVDYYAAAKYGMMGRTAADLASILILREACNEFGPLTKPDEFNRFANSEAALRANIRSDMLVGDTVTLADLILFNALSGCYGSQSWRDKFGPVFTACFPKLANFYHTMLTQNPHLREYIFSAVHTPAVYFAPWTLQQRDCYMYAASDSSSETPPRETSSIDSLDKDAQAIYTSISEKLKEAESLFPLVRDEHLNSDFSTMYLHDSLVDWNKPRDDLLWEFLELVCRDMGVTKIKECSGTSPPADGPVLSWSRKTEMFIPHVYVAARKGKFPLNSASEGAKIFQILSTVRQLIQTWMKNAESFKTDSCDKSKAGNMFSNVSPGNILYLERLLHLNEWREGQAIVGKSETLADIYMFRFMELVDDRLLRSGEGLISWDYWNENYPLLSKFFRSKKVC